MSVSGSVTGKKLSLTQFLAPKALPKGTRIGFLKNSSGYAGSFLFFHNFNFC
jgi:hypothetical protein